MPDPVREPVYLLGGPADGKTVDVPEGSDSVSVLLLVAKNRSWVQVDQRPRGHVEGEVVAAGNYSRTTWDEHGLPVFPLKRIADA